MYITFPATAPYTALAYPVRIQLKASTTARETRTPVSARLGVVQRMVGQSRIAVPAGAHSFTVVDLDGHVLEHRNLTSNERDLSVGNHGGASLVRFDP